MDEDNSRAYSTDDLRLVLLRAWERAGVSVNCELCNNPKWNVVQTGEFDGLSLLLRSGDKTETPGKWYMAYALECQNCGNVRIFSRPTVERLAAELKEITEEAATKEGSEDAGSG